MDGHVWWHCPHRWLCKYHGALKFTVYWAWQLTMHGTTVATQLIDMITSCMHIHSCCPVKDAPSYIQLELFCSHMKWKKHVDKLWSVLASFPCAWERGKECICITIKSALAAKHWSFFYRRLWCVCVCVCVCVWWANSAVMWSVEAIILLCVNYDAFKF